MIRSFEGARPKLHPSAFIHDSAEVIGRVKELRVKEGDQVKKGEILLRLDPAQSLAQVAQLEAALAQSRLNIERQKVTAITLVGGVEPILTAAPAGSPAMVLSPWSLSGGSAEGPTQ